MDKWSKITYYVKEKKKIKLHRFDPRYNLNERKYTTLFSSYNIVKENKYKSYTKKPNLDRID